MEPEHKEYLDELRKGGHINMYEAGDYLQSKFGLAKKEAREVLQEWMQSY